MHDMPGQLEQSKQAVRADSAIQLHSSSSSNCQPCEQLWCSQAASTQHLCLRAVCDTALGDACRDALWLPYRKDRAQLKEAIEGAGDIKAVFAHADVVREAEY